MLTHPFFSDALVLRLMFFSRFAFVALFVVCTFVCTASCWNLWFYGDRCKKLSGKGSCGGGGRLFIHALLIHRNKGRLWRLVP
jgi:hypothetical protein